MLIFLLLFIANGKRHTTFERYCCSQLISFSLGCVLLMEVIPVRGWEQYLTFVFLRPKRQFRSLGSFRSYLQGGEEESDDGRAHHSSHRENSELQDMCFVGWKTREEAYGLRALTWIQRYTVEVHGPLACFQGRVFQMVQSMPLRISASLDVIFLGWWICISSTFALVTSNIKNTYSWSSRCGAVVNESD